MTPIQTLIGGIVLVAIGIGICFTAWGAYCWMVVAGLATLLILLGGGLCLTMGWVQVREERDAKRKDDEEATRQAASAVKE